ncbi:membrane protein [Gordonia phage BiggityBass]|nr:membrane protein [Gordonia phage BiggityBass]
MRTFYRSVMAAIRHRRIVESGSPPLYWQLLQAGVVSGVLQLILGVPPSISNSTGESYTVDYIFMALQLVGGLIALAALYIEDGSSRHAERLYWSLAFEAFGLMLLTTAVLIYSVAVVINNGGPPTSMATWFTVMFGVWAVRTRLPQIYRALRDLRS